MPGSRILSTSFKPPRIGSRTWVKLSEEQKLEAIADHSKKAAVVIECALLGVEGLRSHAVAAQVLAWSKTDCKLQDDVGLEDYCVTQDKGHQLEPEVANIGTNAFMRKRIKSKPTHMHSELLLPTLRLMKAMLDLPLSFVGRWQSAESPGSYRACRERHLVQLAVVRYVELVPLVGIQAR